MPIVVNSVLWIDISLRESTVKSLGSRSIYINNGLIDFVRTEFIQINSSYVT